MIILSIETSCDETAISVVEVYPNIPKYGRAEGDIKNARFKILANNLASQVKLHRKYGGVYPMLAKREHLKNLPILFKKTLKEAKIKEKGIDLIAVTYGPGLEPALWTGLEFAKSLAKKWKVKLVPVNHMEGHAISALLKRPQNDAEQTQKNPPSLKATDGRSAEFQTLRSIEFPALALLISGGHTELVLMKKWMDYKILGETRDDAAGEAFDKVARLLDLPYPGGPQISALAEISRKNAENHAEERGKILRKSASSLRGSARELKLPRPMIKSPDFDFSFSGLKTAVLYLIRDLQKQHPYILKNVRMKSEIAREFQDAVTDVLVSKTMRAVKEFKVKTILTGGGVIANDQIRNTLKKEAGKLSVPIYFPSKELSVDNSIMIALAGYFRYITKSAPSKPHSLPACGGLRLE